MKKVITIVFLYAIVLSGYGQTLKFSTYFDNNKSKLSASNRALLNSFLDTIQITNIKSIDLYGYTDSIGSISYNKNLSRKRVVSVLGFFSKAGIDKEVIDFDYYGELKALSSKELSKDRRVDIVVNFEIGGGVPVQKFSLFESDTTIIETNAGCKIKIRAKDLVTSDNSLIKGPPVVYIREYNDPVDFISSHIPMEDKSKGIFYDSYGMFDIRVFAGEQSLKLRSGAKYIVNCPVANSTRNIGFFEFNEFEGDWSELTELENIAKNSPEPIGEVKKETPIRDIVSETDLNVNSNSLEGEKEVIPVELPLEIIQLKLDTGRNRLVINRNFEINKWRYRFDMSKFHRPICEGNCDHKALFENLLQFEADSIWYNQELDTVKTIALKVNYRLNRYFKSAVFKIELNDIIYKGSEYINGFEWRTRIKGKKADFDSLMQKNWISADFYSIEGSNKKFKITLTSEEGTKNTLVLKKRWFKKGFYDGVEAIELSTDYDRGSYETDYCFWMNNKKFMPQEELSMSFENWMLFYVKNIDAKQNLYKELIPKSEELNLLYCVSDSNVCKFPISSYPTIGLRNIELDRFSLFNYDAIISIKEMIKVEPNFIDSKGIKINVDTVYQMIEGFNSLLTYPQRIDSNQIEIFKNRNSFFYILDRNGRRWMSSMLNTSISKFETIVLIDITEQTKDEYELRKLFNLARPFEEWLRSNSVN